MEWLEELHSSLSMENTSSLCKKVSTEFQNHPVRTSGIVLFCAFTAVPLLGFIVFVVSSVIFTVIVASFWEAVFLLFAGVLFAITLLCTTCLASCMTGCFTVVYLLYLSVFKVVTVTRRRNRVQELELEKED